MKSLFDFSFFTAFLRTNMSKNSKISILILIGILYMLAGWMFTIGKQPTPILLTAFAFILSYNLAISSNKSI